MLNVQTTVPLYAEIQRNFQTLIRSGSWPPGHRIPSEQELLKQYDCSRMTVNKALSALASAGLIVRKRRYGSFVAAPTSQETVLEIHDITSEVQKSGRRYDYELLQRQVRRATADDAFRLGVKIGTEILALHARHNADGAPFVIEDRLMNLTSVPDARSESFRDKPGGTWLLERVPWTDAEHSIRAVSADRELAAKLRIPKNSACLLVERRTWQAGAPITSVRLFYPGDRHSLVARFNPTPESESRLARKRTSSGRSRRPAR
jgi:GntR family histidine utilization transcriptional repressor